MGLKLPTWTPAMSAPSPPSPDRPAQPLRPAPRAPLALSRRFLAIEVDEASALTHGATLEMVEAHAAAAWIVLRWWRHEVRFSVLPRQKFLAWVQERDASRLLLATLRVTPPATSITLTLAQYQTADAGGALVVDDGGLVGVTEPWGEEVRGLAATRGQTQADDGQTFGREYPHRLDTLMPAQVRVGDEVTLVVTLDRIHQASTSEQENTDEEIRLNLGEALDITVQGDAWLQPVGANSVALAVQAGKTANAARFTFKAISAGPANVKVYAFRRGMSVGRLVVGVQVVHAHQMQHLPKDCSAELLVPQFFPVVSPDLRLVVLEGHESLSFQLWHGTQRIADYPALLVKDLPEYMRHFVQAIEGLKLGKAEAVDIALRRLQAWGANLFTKLIPEGLQRFLWSRRNDASLTLQICSDDAWIPWEVCRLSSRDADGRIEDGPFFAEAFAMTRWLHGKPPPAQFSLSRCALVVPKDSGLGNAERERSYYLGLADDQRRVCEVAARYLPLTLALELGHFDAWHFCGHANAGAVQQGDRATLRLEGNETMSADLFAGTVENALIPRPFVFFNACQSALGGQSTTGVGGWAHRFIRPNQEGRSAAAFIGTYWSVYDEAALRFATELYQQLTHGVPIGVAARAARQKAMASDDDAITDPLSWLAYTVYADPLATMEARHA
jgi:hypothetical protein